VAATMVAITEEASLPFRIHQKGTVDMAMGDLVCRLLGKGSGPAIQGLVCALSPRLAPSFISPFPSQSALFLWQRDYAVDGDEW
jgi:hypothetical protein